MYLTSSLFQHNGGVSFRKCFFIDSLSSFLFPSFSTQLPSIAGGMNFFFVDCISYGLFGYTVFPYDEPENSRQHGVVLDYRSIDGDVCTGGCQGDTGVHELGHAFGLYHTFQSQVTLS